ncbi:hypothetical protein [Natronorubrum aibiense]|uniref:Uncharacterized protein n=1 Tax=Natronorubrum aibiense TaxID=348826 RepID=A0A5P9P6U0_9EURY|nr:hypothetical protein [Natronorubrum aibiense]QFU83853.1 hypothetical protein GCU68_15565 [Natronorubrum aibiense]
MVLPIDIPTVLLLAFLGGVIATIGPGGFLYAEQAQYHGLQAVDTRRHSMMPPTDRSIARVSNPNVQITRNPTLWQGQIGTERIPNDLRRSFERASLSRDDENL